MAVRTVELQNSSGAKPLSSWTALFCSWMVGCVLHWPALPCAGLPQAALPRPSVWCFFSARGNITLIFRWNGKMCFLSQRRAGL